MRTQRAREKQIIEKQKDKKKTNVKMKFIQWNTIIHKKTIKYQNNIKHQ